MNQIRSIVLRSLATLFLLQMGCSTPQVIFSSDKKATVSLVNFNDFTTDGQILGEAPQTITTDKLASRFVKVWGENMVPQYWVFNDLLGKETKISLKMEDLPNAKDKKKGDKEGEDKPEDKKGGGGEGDGTLGPVEMNMSFRLMMQAYHALTVGDFDGARELANKLKEINPKVASPHVLIGIAYLQQGSKSDASAAFSIAKSLDPQDADIDRLIEAAQ